MKMKDEHRADQADRQVEEENPAPARIGGDEAADRRPKHGADHRRHAHRRASCTSPPLPTARNSTSRPTGTIIAPPRPWKTRQSANSTHTVAEAAQHRAEGEDSDRRAEDSARAEMVGEPAADRNEYGQAEDISGDADREMDRRRPEIDRHLRQSGGDHRAVEILHEESRSDDPDQQTMTRDAERHPGKPRERSGVTTQFMARRKVLKPAPLHPYPKNPDTQS